MSNYTAAWHFTVHKWVANSSILECSSENFQFYWPKSSKTVFTMSTIIIPIEPLRPFCAFNNFLLSLLGVWILASVSVCAGVCFALIGSCSETATALVFRKSSAHILLSQDINIMISAKQCFPWLHITRQANSSVRAHNCIQTVVSSHVWKKETLWTFLITQKYPFNAFCSGLMMVLWWNDTKKVGKAFRTAQLHLHAVMGAVWIFFLAMRGWNRPVLYAH